MIKRGEGLTPSERRLVALAERTFLRLWSYPNAFNDRTRNASGGGQEIADLLAVFEKHVVIFSDKEIAWQFDKPVDLAWSRWYRRAVDGAVAQLIGAERWLDRHPDRIFTDKQCRQRLPIPLPSPPERIVHLIAIAGGANGAARRYFGHPRGTFIIQPDIKGEMHLDAERTAFHPFIVGDVNPRGTFVHLFDPVGLEFVMGELDTVADFTAYLVARSKLIRSGKLGIATGEEDLLASYMMNGFIEGRPSFLPENLRKKARRKQLQIPEGEYETYVTSRAHAGLAALKRQSMLWDEIIEILSEGTLAGTSIRILGQEPDPQLSESGLRVMAAERRLDRAKLGHSLDDAMRRSLDEGLPRFVRRVLISRKHPRREVGYVFLLLPMDESAGNPAEYRRYRSEMLSIYVLSLLREQRKLDIAVGLALDLIKVGSEMRTRSEDLVAIEAPEWTPDLLAYLETNRTLFGCMDPTELKVAAIKQRLKNPFRVQKPGRTRKPFKARSS